MVAETCFKYGSYPYPKVSFVLDDLYRKVIAFRSTAPTTTIEETIETKLFNEIDNVYEECKENNWDYEDACGISLVSAYHAKEFVKYIDGIKTPNVLPFTNGNMGFSWNIKNSIIISIVFKPDNNFIFSIIAPGIKEYGINIKNVVNQKTFVEKISRILNSVC